MAVIDNQVPTPASVAETPSLQVLPNFPTAEPKAEPEEGERDFKTSKKRPEVKMEVRNLD